MLGANPVVSQGSLMMAPDVERRLAALRARAGKLVVIAPRRSETAELADEHHAIVPGSDAAFVLAMVRVVIEEGRVELGRAVPYADGLELLLEAVRPCTPERVESRCGIEVATLRRLALEFAEAPSAVAYGRMGASVESFGTLTLWALELLTILTANLDWAGGAMFVSPAAPFH